MKAENLAAAFSWIFHPTVMTAALFLAASPALGYGPLGAAIAVFTYSLLPLTLLAALRAFGLVSSFDVVRTSQRLAPLMLAEASYVVGIITTALVSRSRGLLLLEVLYLVNSAIVIIVTLLLKFKISIHVSTASAIVTAIVYLDGLSLLPLFAIPAALTWARVRLGVHTIRQVAAGWAFMPLTLVQLFLYLGPAFKH